MLNRSLKQCFFQMVPDFKGNSAKRLREVSVNDGLHFHGVMLVKAESRLNTDLDEHFSANKTLYQTSKLYRIDIQKIDDDPIFVTDYAGKALKTQRFSMDDLLVLPRTIREVREFSPELSADARFVRDVQARLNCSDETAAGILAERKAKQKQRRPKRRSRTRRR